MGVIETKMAGIDLPRALQDYFAFAETTPTRIGRRFSITLPYLRQDGRLDKLQWWYHLAAAREKALGDRAPETVRSEAIARFRVHIERWLQNTSQLLQGSGPIPQVAAADRREGGYASEVADGDVATEELAAQDAAGEELAPEGAVPQELVSEEVAADDAAAAPVTAPLPPSQSAFG